MSEKRVLVIDKDKFQDAIRVALKESPDKYLFRDRLWRILRDFALPGNLLVEFKGYTDKTIIDHFTSEKDEGQLFQMWKRKNVCGADMDGPFTILILARTDAGSEVKNGS